MDLLITSDLQAERYCDICGRIERWKPVIGYEKYYSVSSFGRVYSIRFDKVLSPGLSSGNGYFKFGLCVNGKIARVFVHDVVAKAFVGEKPFGFDVDHRDRNKRNNHDCNLRFLPKIKNRSFPGEKNGNSSMSDDLRDSIRTLRRKGWTFERLSKYYDIPMSTVYYTVSIAR